MWPRANDTFGFNRRAPFWSLPRLPTLPSGPPSAAQCGGESYVVWACTAGYLVPARPPPPSQLARSLPGWRPDVMVRLPANRSPLLLPRTAGAVDVFVATCDHYGHGLFALVERILNQIMFAKRQVGRPS